MKICPKCQKTYTDENLNFCLEDGTVLTQAGGGPPPETVLMNQPRVTAPNQPMGSQPTIQSGWNNPPPPYTMQPQKSSKTWLWILGILGVIVLLCGGGFVGIALIATYSKDANSNKVVYNPDNTSKPPTPTPDTRTDIQKVDLSEWVRDFSVYGTTEFTGSDFIMASKQKGYYYVLVAPAEYSTEGANTRVSLRNIDDASSSLGYGLIFHSNPTPLTQDYALLIDTKKKKYRVVRHEPQKETSVVTWTTSSAIKEGSAENILEVRDKADKIELWINGQMVNSIKNTHGYKGGVAGLYSGDSIKIAFRNLEISK